VVALLAWVTFPAGGVYPEVWIPAAVAALLMALTTRPGIAHDRALRKIDFAVIAVGLAIIVQLIPLPRATLNLVDPHVIPLRTALWLPASASLRLPATLMPADTVAAFGIFAAAGLLFWTCRRVCEGGGTGRIIRGIAAIGLIASVTAVVQYGGQQQLLYGYWLPRDAGARPYGPFINRNHFATWMIMACPLVFGYLLARAPAAPERQQMAQRAVAALKQLGSMRIWLAISVCMMALAVTISTSRSGVIGLAAGFAASALLSRRHHVPNTRRWTIFQAVLLVLTVVSFANFDALARRADQTVQDMEAGRGRSAIWHDAETLIRDFPLTGSGAGTFASAVKPYQTALPAFSLGNAHNHYLHLAAEGGALVTIPCAFALVCLLLLFRRRMADDTSPNALVRAGAGAGLTAVLVQSIWETGLRMPANAMLCAVLAAVAIHTPPVSRERERGAR
jgi:O-antigen ligase